MPQKIEEQYQPLDLAAAADILSAISARSNSDRVRLALDRFDKGMRRRTPRDTALEMAVALEAMLGEGARS